MFKYFLTLLPFAITFSSPAFSMERDNTEGSDFEIFTAQIKNRGSQENQTVADGFEKYINTANQKFFQKIHETLQEGLYSYS